MKPFLKKLEFIKLHDTDLYDWIMSDWPEYPDRKDFKALDIIIKSRWPFAFKSKYYQLID